LPTILCKLGFFYLEEKFKDSQEKNRYANKHPISIDVHHPDNDLSNITDFKDTPIYIEAFEHEH
jgi:hypothetical protein